MVTGIIAGLLSALLQAVSYLCSAEFMLKYKSSLRLVIFSQLAMGVFCLPFLPFLFPRQLSGMLPEFLLWTGAWIVCFTVGQTAFFNTLRTIEASRMSSLLGLKIIVLSVIYVLIMRTPLSFLQWIAVLMSSLAAVGMNWSGGARFSLKGILWLLVTLIAYSLTDMTETHLVSMPKTVPRRPKQTNSATWERYHVSANGIDLTNCFVVHRNFRRNGSVRIPSSE